MQDVRARAFVPLTVPAQAAMPKEEAPDLVPIPENWLDLPSAQVVALSRRLGARPNNRYTQAIVWIEKVIASRKQAAPLQGAA